MALLLLNKNKLTVQVLVGALESYTPDSEIETIIKKLDELRTLTQSEIIKVVGNFENQQQAFAELKKDKEKMSKWKKFLDGDFSKKFKDVDKKIEDKNKQICPNYKDIEKKKG